MEFEWDEVKSEACLAERGFDVVRAFFDPNRAVKADERWDYGEDRYQILGAIDGWVFFVAYTLRGRIIRIISAARKANGREVYDYESTAR